MRAHATFFLLLFSTLHVQAQGHDGVARTASFAHAPHRFFGDFTMGISNYGMAGQLGLYYRLGSKFFSAGYYQSHVCTVGDYNGIPPWGSGGVTYHVSINSYSAGFGYMLPARGSKQGLSAGISISRIMDERTDPILNDFSVDGLYRELSGAGFDDHSHGSESKVVAGIPIEYRVFLFDRRTIGLDMAYRIDLNTTMVFSSITLGLRIGNKR